MITVAIKERPILFSAPMVLALLAGRKTQTRRPLNLRKLGVGFCGAGGKEGDDWNNPCCWGYEDEYGDWWTLASESPGNTNVIGCPYGAPGDRLWVRETFSLANEEASGPGDCVFRADCTVEVPGIRWTSPIFMPRWASRITLEITEVRVERVQDISEADAQAEGCSRPVLYDPSEAMGFKVHPMTGNYADAYAALWESINGKGSWADNPWCWALTFKVVTNGS